MSIKRYEDEVHAPSSYDFEESDNGTWVKYEDHAAEIARLEEQVLALSAENAALKSGVDFFSYGTDSGYEEHATADEAIKAADSDIDYYRGEACDGWSEETDRTVWGVVIQRASMVGLHTETDDSGNTREICDYTLLPSVETPTTDAVLREVGAKAVEGFVKYCGTENSVFVETKAYYRSLEDASGEYADLIRSGEVTNG